MLIFPLEQSFQMKILQAAKDIQPPPTITTLMGRFPWNRKFQWILQLIIHLYPKSTASTPQQLCHIPEGWISSYAGQITRI